MRRKNEGKYFSAQKIGIRTSFLFSTDEGQLWTCGSNNKGQLGVGTTDDVTTLTLVSGLEDVAMAVGGWDFSLAITGL